jgi:TonB family protein
MTQFFLPKVFYGTLLIIFIGISPSKALSQTPDTAKKSAPEEKKGSSPKKDSAKPVKDKIKVKKPDGTAKKTPKNREKPNIEYPKLKKFVSAPYPSTMRKAGKEGVVKMTLSLDDKGFVVDVKVIISAGKEFDLAAVAAAKQWLFVPAKLDGKPIPSKIPISYPFRLKNKGVPKKPDKIPTCVPKNGIKCPKAVVVKVIKISCDPKTDSKCKRHPVVKNPVCDPTIDPKCKVSTAKYGLGKLDPKLASKVDLKHAGIAVIKGTIWEKGSATRIEDAEVAVYNRIGKKGVGTKVTSTFSSKRGSFTLKVYPGSYIIKVLAPGCHNYQTTEKLGLSERITVEYFIRRKIDDLYTTTVVGKKDRKEVTRYTVTLPEIIAIPGTQGDALKAIQNMPGVARSPFGLGLLVIRGSAPGDTKIYFEGHETVQLYHFLGLTSVFNSDLLKKIDFIPGNFSPRYGNGMGGVINVTTRKPKTDGYHGYIDMDIWDAGLLLEGPMPGIFNKGSIAISYRRSWIDALIRPFEKYIGIAPYYQDYQVIMQHPLLKGNLKAVIFGSNDRLVLLADDFAPYKTNFNKAILLWSRKWGKNELKMSASYGIPMTSFDTPGNQFAFKYEMKRASWRLEYFRKLHKKFRLGMGLDGQFTDLTMKIKFSSVVGADDNEGDTDVNNGNFLWEEKAEILRQAAWFEGDWRPTDRLAFFPGLRLDFWNTKSKSNYSVDPRFTMKYDLIKKKLAIKAGLGLFSQTPEFYQYSKDIGNPDIKHENAIHASSGFKWQVIRSMSIGVTGFYKHLYGLVAPSDKTIQLSDTEEQRLNIENTGNGRIYGAEFMLKKNNSLQCPPYIGFKKCFGWVSYTLLRSERRDTKDGEWYLFDFDQTHILTAIFSGKWSNGWGFGVRFRLTSGNPTTDYIGSVYMADYGEYEPIMGKRNDGRLPLFHQLDIRIDKTWKFNRWSFGMYLDIQNLYNYQTSEFQTYNYNYTEKTVVNGLPIVPSLGFKGSF